jgi:hypothetical protein
MARKINRRQKPAWQKLRKPKPHPPKKKSRTIQNPSGKK